MIMSSEWPYLANTQVTLSLSCMTFLTQSSDPAYLLTLTVTHMYTFQSSELAHLWKVMQSTHHSQCRAIQLPPFGHSYDPLTCFHWVQKTTTMTTSTYMLVRDDSQLTLHTCAQRHNVTTSRNEKILEQNRKISINITKFIFLFRFGLAAACP